MVFPLLAAGCAEDGVEETGPAGVEGVYPEASPQGELITADDYIEYVARVQLIQSRYQERFAEAVAAEDMAQAEEIQDEFQAEAEDILTELAITYGQLNEFEGMNPGFLEDPEVQQRIVERMQELSQ